MYGFLRRPRWIAFLLLVVVLVVAFIELAAWQERRHDQRRARNAVISQNADASPVPGQDLLVVGRDVDDSLEWRQVVLDGRWDAGAEVLVRNRPREGRSGYLVVTPFVPDSGPALLVERGWVPAGATAATRPDVPDPQAGQVEITARLRPAEPPRSSGELPDGQVLRIDTPAIADGLDYPVAGGYGELVVESPTPVDALPLPAEPEPSAGPHLGYAVQWVLFACVAVGGMVVLIRREAEYLRDERTARDDTQDAPTTTGRT